MTDERDERHHWPWTSFRAQNEYAQLPNADLARLPHELDTSERLRVRFLFVSWKVALLIPGGIIAGWLAAWLSGGRVGW